MNDSMYVKQFQSIDVFFLSDGWFNATVASSKFGKDPNSWLRSFEAFRYGMALNNLLNPNNCIPKPELEKYPQQRQRELILQFLKDVDLVRTKQGSVQNGGGTWMHPKLGVVFARWLSVDFELWCDSQIEEIIKTDGRQSYFDLGLVFHPLYRNLPVVKEIEDVELIGVRNSYVSTLTRLGFPCNRKRFLTDLVYDILIGMKAQTFRRRMGLPAGSRQRTRLRFDGNVRRCVAEVEEFACGEILTQEVTEWEDVVRIVEQAARHTLASRLESNINLRYFVPHFPRRGVVRVG